MTNFDLLPSERKELWNYIIPVLEKYYSNTSDLKVTPSLKFEEIKSYAGKHSFDESLQIEQAVDHVISGLKNYAVHTPHPMYYGLYNPRTNFPSIVSDLINATFNPQLAAWSHSPFAAEAENYLINEFGKKFGYKEESIDGTFTTGGAEANLTAVLTALNYKFPEYANVGLAGLSVKPVFYCSAESHHSVIRAARICGLGLDSVRPIEVDERQRINMQKLAEQIRQDKAEGLDPFMIIATAGSTGTGAIDELPIAAKIAKEFNLWFHVDAAYGGAIAILEDKKYLLEGIAEADSITFDAHKWLSVPMSTGIYFTRHKNILSQTFRTSADYMPKDAGSMEITDPFTHSIQWSRRFIGLKLYLPMLVFGWKGYAEVIEHQIKIGNYLKEKLERNNWLIINSSALPVVCFTNPAHLENDQFVLKVVDKIIKSGRAWVSVYKVGKVNCIRACITNYLTKQEEIDKLVELLEEVKG
jgi:aromatic-L-amino-acid/L-tryptophan decarboxylase